MSVKKDTLYLATYLSEQMPGETFFVQYKGSTTKVTSNVLKAIWRKVCGWKCYCKIRNGRFVL